MTAKKKTKYGVFEGDLYYARIFEDNIDDSEYHERTEGQFNTVFVPKDDDELQKIVEMGFPEESMGNRMIKPIAAADNRAGMKLKRPNKRPCPFSPMKELTLVWVGMIIFFLVAAQVVQYLH